MIDIEPSKAFRLKFDDIKADENKYLIYYTYMPGEAKQSGQAILCRLLSMLTLSNSQ